MIGQDLSHYRITAALGAGGMGEVYRATDTNLRRDVAIKVLPPEVSQDPERLERFRREAHLLASLNHPNIAAIYGLEEAEGRPFLALELVEGEDLAERLKRGAIPIEEAIEIARQVAEGLEEAHDNGIVHRDLKPANVKITPGGKVKVLDFGLAKAWGAEAGSGGSSAELSQSPTLARTGTLAGVILGTAAYMSPEQASGKAVDKRADIWSFGVVLFEMLTGRRLFNGETASETLASVIKDEPGWDSLPDACPPAVRRLLRRCLRKRPRERLQDIGDARLELGETLAGEREEGAADTPGPGVQAFAARERRLRAFVRAWAAVALVAAGLAAFLAYGHLGQTPPARPSAHFVVEMPPAGWKLQSFDAGPDALAVSPDGRHIATSSSLTDYSSRQLWVRSLSSLDVRPLPGTDWACAPFWSPDGQWLAFFAQGELRKVRLAGGSAQRLCSLPGAGEGGSGWSQGGTWSSAGTIVFSVSGADSRARLYAVAASGGEPRLLAEPDTERRETGYHWPHFLPDGRRLLYVAASQRATSLHVASLDTPGDATSLLPAVERVLYASGHLLYQQDETLFARPFDAARARVTGEPWAVTSALASSETARVGARGLFSSAPGGVLAYLESVSQDFDLTWFDRSGDRLGTVGEPGAYGQIGLSPDGRQVVAEKHGDQGYDLWTIDVTRGVADRVTSESGDERDPVWSPSGQEIVYRSRSPDGGFQIMRKDLRGGTAAPLMFESPGMALPESISGDDSRLFFITREPRNPARQEWPSAVRTLRLESAGEPETIFESVFPMDEAQISPDGRWLAYLSFEAGQFDVYVEPFPRTGERVRVTPSGGGQPEWRGDGEELFYVAPDGRLMSVDVREGRAGLEVGLPGALFDTGLLNPTTDGYAVRADGQRFLVKVPVGVEFTERTHIVTHWTSLLESR